MLILAKKKIAPLVVCLALLGLYVAPSVAYATEDSDLTRLKQQLQIGEAAEAKLAARRDLELKKIFNSGLSQKQIEIKAEAVLETYRVESSKLVAAYRQPLMDHLQRKYPGLKDSVGTPLYAKDTQGNVLLDAQGRKVIHSDFRGWSGDHDMQGSATDVAKAKKHLNDNGFATTGFGSKELKDLTPGDLSNKRLELTINLDPSNQSIKKLLQDPSLTPEARQKLEMELARSQQADSMLKAGDSAHQNIAHVAARGKETYVAVSMQNGQPGLKAVLANDHFKKAAEGLGMSGEALLNMDNRDAFQGMVKGTDKAVRDSQLDAATIEASLKKHQLDMSAADYQALVTKLKVKPYPQIYGLDAAKIESLKNVNQELLDQSVTKTLKDAAAEVESHRKKVAELSTQITEATDPAEKQKLSAQREILGREIVDTRVKLQEVLAANDERRKKYDLPPREKVAEADSLKLTPETAPSSSHASLKAKSDLKQAAKKGLAAAGQTLELYGFYTTAMKHAEEVVAESSPSDSDTMLIIEATKRGTMEAIGLTDAIEISKENLPLMRDAMENIHAGNYFTGFYQWKAAMALGMWELGKKQFNDMILTPLQDTGIAVYEGGRVVYDVLKNEVSIARNEAEQAVQQESIAQKKAEQEAINRPAMETHQEINAPALRSIDSAAETEPTPIQEEAMQHDGQIDPQVVSEERMLVTEVDDNAIVADSLQSGLDVVAKEQAAKELTKEDVYRLVPKDTMMAYSERVALAQKMLADEAKGGGDMQIDPNAVAEDRMILSPASDAPIERMILTQEPQPKSSTVHTEPMIDGDAMEETIVRMDAPSVGGSAQSVEELCYGKDSAIAIRDDVEGYVAPGEPGAFLEGLLCGLKTKEGKLWRIDVGVTIGNVQTERFPIPIVICGKTFYTGNPFGTSDVENGARNWRDTDKKHYEPMFTDQLTLVVLHRAHDSLDFTRSNGKKAMVYKRIISCPTTKESYERLRLTGSDR